tara:strand:- start:1293 stop:3365 length:2073 start_codon:yes stop_codon:yes gene_type:complete
MKNPLLIEIGLEELPPLLIKHLSETFCDSIKKRLASLGYETGGSKSYGTPRRIACVIEGIPEKQNSKEILKRGPGFNRAFDADGNPTKAALGFAQSCGVDLKELERFETKDGVWLAHRTTVEGGYLIDDIPQVVDQTLKKIPLPRKMRWGDGDEEFIRPIRWVTVFHGDKLAKGKVFNIDIGNFTYGHRHMGGAKLALPNVNDYSQILKDNYVICDFDERKKTILAEVHKLAGEHNCKPIVSENLLEEVCSLVEWPRAILGTFDESFLTLPEEVIMSTMQDHQKYFPLRDDSGDLKNAFITIANIESRKEDIVRKGNERVITPRLEDAKFFYQQDIKTPLLERYQRLAGVVFERRLGSLLEKSERIAKITQAICTQFNAREEVCRLAAKASRCDLTTDMVREFPGLQGIMGGCYASLKPETAQIEETIRYFYHPRFANDRLPSTTEGQCLSFADKLDTVVGICGIGLKPTGDKDPFALRRAAIGLIRILLEKKIDIDLNHAIEIAAKSYERSQLIPETLAVSSQFIFDRMKGYLADKGVKSSVSRAVFASESLSPLDLSHRIDAIQSFSKLPQAADLIASHKRISNILKKKEEAKLLSKPRKDLLEMPAEIALVEYYEELQQTTNVLYGQKDYQQYLIEIAGCKTHIDRFFDEVKVITDNKEITENRLSIMNEANELLCRIGDLTHLDLN